MEKALGGGRRPDADPSHGPVSPRHQIRKDFPMMIPRTVAAFMLSLMLASLMVAL